MQHILSGLITQKNSPDALSFLLNEPGHFYETGYRVLQSRGDGFVPCVHVLFNGKDKLVYNITGLAPLAQILNGLTADQFLRVLLSIFEGLASIDKIGFIDQSGILLSINDIFINRDTWRAYFIYLPLEFGAPAQQDIKQMLRQQLAYIIAERPNLQDIHTENIRQMLLQAGMGAEAISVQLRSYLGGAGTTGEATGSITGNVTESRELAAADAASAAHTKKTRGAGFAGLFGRRARRSAKAPVEIVDEGGMTEVLELFIPSIVIAVDGGSGKAEILVSKPDFVIGKKEGEVDGLIGFNNAISRRHCKITFDGSTHYIEDLGSANGTFLNGKRLPPHQKTAIKVGDSIRLANSSFSIKSV